MLSLQAGKPSSLGTRAVLIAWKRMWFYIKPFWLGMSQSASWNNELTSEVLFFFFFYVDEKLEQINFELVKPLQIFPCVVETGICAVIV